MKLKDYIKEQLQHIPFNEVNSKDSAGKKYIRLTLLNIDIRICLLAKRNIVLIPEKFYAKYIIDTQYNEHHDDDFYDTKLQTYTHAKLLFNSNDLKEFIEHCIVPNTIKLPNPYKRKIYTLLAKYQYTEDSYVCKKLGGSHMYNRLKFMLTKHCSIMFNHTSKIVIKLPSLKTQIPFVYRYVLIIKKGKFDLSKNTDVEFIKNLLMYVGLRKTKELK